MNSWTACILDRHSEGRSRVQHWPSRVEVAEQISKSIFEACMTGGIIVMPIANTEMRGFFWIDNMNEFGNC